jgi:undecaprenyl-diphosphatase
LFTLTLALGYLGKTFGSPGPDLALDQLLIPARNPVLTGLFLAVNGIFSPLGNVIILVLGCLLLMILKKPLTAIAFGSLVLVGWLSSEPGKMAILRLRPPADATQALIAEAGHDSFPSGHTAFAAALAWGAILVLAHTRHQRRVTAVAGAVLVMVVAYSRLYLGVHYPSDVLGAVLISTAAIIFWLPVWNRLLEPPLRRSSLIARMTNTPTKEEMADE